MFDFDQTYLIYLLIGLSAAMFAEGGYLIFYSNRSYRQNVNRRLVIMNEAPNRESVLVQLRRERGLTTSGNYRLPFVTFNQLLLQSGLSIGFKKSIFLVVAGMIATFGITIVIDQQPLHGLVISILFGLLVPPLLLWGIRRRRQKKFSAQFPDAIDVIVRSLRAGHPVPVAIDMVARELPDPIGSEFGIVGDEITYGAALETAMRDLYFRVGTDDLPLFVTAVAIQSSTGGNLGEILQNLSGVIRQRFKMRRKIRALAAEARASALILSLLPIGIFAAVQIVTPEFYASVWHESLTKTCLSIAGGWMAIGIFIMYRMVNFRI